MVMPLTGLRVAVVGAGIAGLNCAARLMSLRIDVQIFERSRSLGGRAIHRREGPWRFDPGAPAANDLVRRLSAGLPVATGTRVTRLVGIGDGRWQLETDPAYRTNPFDFVVLAMPPAQAEDLLAAAPGMAHLAASVPFDACLTAMVGFTRAIGIAQDELRPVGGPLARALRQPVDPALGSGEGWVLHGTPDFSRDNLEFDLETVTRALLHDLRRVAGPLPTPTYLRGYRWRQARVLRPLGMDCLFDSTRGLGLCGDWCCGDDVRAALRSGRAMASRIASARQRPPELDALFSEAIAM